MGSKHDGLEARCADFVDGSGIGAGLHSGSEGDLTGGRLTDTSLDDIAKVDFLSNRGIDFRCLESMLESSDTQLRGRQGL